MAVFIYKTLEMKISDTVQQRIQKYTTTKKYSNTTQQSTTTN